MPTIRACIRAIDALGPLPSFNTLTSILEALPATTASPGTDATSFWDAITTLCRILYIQATKDILSREESLIRDTTVSILRLLFNIMYEYCYTMPPIEAWASTDLPVPIQCENIPVLLKNVDRFKLFSMYVGNGVHPDTAISVIANLHRLQPRNINVVSYDFTRIPRELRGHAKVFLASYPGDGSTWQDSRFPDWDVFAEEPCKRKRNRTRVL